MPRNLERRVEILFPIEDEKLKKKALHILDGELRDTLKSSIMQADGTYEKVDRRGKENYSSQDAFVLESIEEAKKSKEIINKRVFVPAQHVEE